MNDFDDIQRKRLYKQWNKLNRDFAALILQIDRENARSILDESGMMLMSYPKIEEFMIEYLMYLNKSLENKEANLLDNKDKGDNNNVVSIFDYKREED